ncbi:LptF/LptG family permease, partial [Myxococcota bacterium]|nr:LptF/LptG family permease [Myxococcota bacterium]
AAARRQRADGEWTAMRAAGVRGRALLPAALILALGVGAVSWRLHHEVEPRARAALKEAARDGLRPRPNQLLQLGGVALIGAGVDGAALTDVRIVWEREGQLTVGWAARASWQAEGVVLERGVLHHPEDPELRIDFGRATLSAPQTSARVELVERSDASLRGLIERMESRGRRAEVERAWLYRRDAAPVAAAIIPILSLPLALRGRPERIFLWVLVYWALNRLVDPLASVLPGLFIAWTPTFALALGAAWVWAGWRDR